MFNGPMHVLSPHRPHLFFFFFFWTLRTNACSMITNKPYQKLIYYSIHDESKIIGPNIVTANIRSATLIGLLMKALAGFFIFHGCGREGARIYYEKADIHEGGRNKFSLLLVWFSSLVVLSPYFDDYKCSETFLFKYRQGFKYWISSLYLMVFFLITESRISYKHIKDMSQY